MYLLNRLFNPDIFQGRFKKKNYFEGWYFKTIDRSMKNVLAIIPGVSFDKLKKNCHAFVQVLDAHSCKVDYLKYDISAFNFKKDKFEIEIGDNYFSNKEIRLDIKDDELIIKGRLRFENIVVYPKTVWRPGVMGPYSFVPLMECYHGIVNIHHDIFGLLNINGKDIDFTDGYGYIEKDWGRSFPEAWIWLQSNHFQKDDVSVMFSFAKIPWLGRYFMGLISFIRIKGKTYLFATYTGAKVLELSYFNNTIKVVLGDSKYKLELVARHSNVGILKAPKNGLMQREVLESITAVVNVRLSAKDDRTIYEGTGTNTGLEIESGIFKYFNEQQFSVNDES